jgi:cell division protein FtsW
MGMIANAARHEPAAVAALRAGRDDRVNRVLRLPLPAPYVPTRTEAVRDRLRSRTTTAKPKAKTKPVRKAVPARKAQGSGHHRVGQRHSGHSRASRSGGGRRRAMEGQHHR